MRAPTGDESVTGVCQDVTRCHNQQPTTSHGTQGTQCKLQGLACVIFLTRGTHCKIKGLTCVIFLTIPRDTLREHKLEKKHQWILFSFILVLKWCPKLCPEAIILLPLFPFPNLQYKYMVKDYDKENSCIYRLLFVTTYYFEFETVTSDRGRFAKLRITSCIILRLCQQLLE